MRDRVLEVDVSADGDRQHVPLSSRLQDHVETLEREDYRLVRLRGVGRILTRNSQGESDIIEVFVDPDVQFLLAYYRELEEIIGQARRELVRVYVVDGCFEISSFVQPDDVYVRAGTGGSSAESMGG